jgi:hypothetical protein
MIEAEKQRIKEREEKHRTNLILGTILVPVFFLGWFPIVWVLSKFVG